MAESVQALMEDLPVQVSQCRNQENKTPKALFFWSNLVVLATVHKTVTSTENLALVLFKALGL